MDNQTLLQQKIEFDIMKQLSDLQDRMDAVEYAIYKTENPDNRFTHIYEKLTYLEASRVKDIEESKNQRLNIDTKFEETLFTINGQMKSLDKYKI